MQQNDRKRRKPTSPDATINDIPTDVISFMFQFIPLVELLASVGTCKLFQSCYKRALRKAKHLTFYESDAWEFIDTVKLYCNPNTVESLHFPTFSNGDVNAPVVLMCISCKDMALQIQTLHFCNADRTLSSYMRICASMYPHLRNLRIEFLKCSDMSIFITIGLHFPKLECLSMKFSGDATPVDLDYMSGNRLYDYQDFFKRLPRLRSLYLADFGLNEEASLSAWVLAVGDCVPALEELTLPWKIYPVMFTLLRDDNDIFPVLKELKVNLAALDDLEVQKSLCLLRSGIEVSHVNEV